MADTAKNALAAHPAVSAFTEGVGKGFLMYFLPVTVLRRSVQKSVMQRALAAGIFCGVVRVVRYFTQYREKRVERCLAIANDKRQSVFIRLFEFIRAITYKYPCHIAGIAGAIAGAATDPSLAQSQLFAIWLLVRAVRCISPSVPYGSVIAMSLSAAQILSCYARAPRRLDSSYLRFLEIQGGLTKEAIHIIRTRNDLKSLCGTIHPNQSCPSFWVTFFLNGFRRAMRVYAPLYVVFFLFSRSKNIMYLVQNLMRSSAFLALYCTLAWMSGCLFHRFIPGVNMSRKTLFLHTSVAGLATFVERDHRRSELAAYCVTYALDSGMKSLVDRLPKIPFLNVFIFCIALAILVRHRKQQPWIFSHFMLGDDHPHTQKSKEHEEE